MTELDNRYNGIFDDEDEETFKTFTQVRDSRRSWCRFSSCQKQVQLFLSCTAITKGAKSEHVSTCCLRALEERGGIVFFSMSSWWVCNGSGKSTMALVDALIVGLGYEPKHSLSNEFQLSANLFSTYLVKIVDYYSIFFPQRVSTFLIFIGFVHITVVSLKVEVKYND